jgi:hypothetical protein
LRDAAGAPDAGLAAADDACQLATDAAAPAVTSLPDALLPIIGNRSWTLGGHLCQVVHGRGAADLVVVQRRVRLTRPVRQCVIGDHLLGSTQREHEQHPRDVVADVLEPVPDAARHVDEVFGDRGEGGVSSRNSSSPASR